MARVTFTPTLQRHIACPPVEVKAATVREALEGAFAGNALPVLTCSTTSRRCASTW